MASEEIPNPTYTVEKYGPGTRYTWLPCWPQPVPAVDYSGSTGYELHEPGFIVLEADLQAVPPNHRVIVELLLN